MVKPEHLLIQIMTTHPNTHAITVTHLDHVATIALERPPHNFVDAEVICQLADELGKVCKTLTTMPV